MSKKNLYEEREEIVKKYFGTKEFSKYKKRLEELNKFLDKGKWGSCPNCGGELLYENGKFVCLNCENYKYNNYN